MTKPKVSIIVISYNTKELTTACLRSVFEEAGDTHFEIIVVDNASPDSSSDAIKKEFPHLLLIAEEVNHGFAAANNLAARRADGEFLLLLNPDTVVLNRAIEKLLAFAEHEPNAGIWGGKTLYADRTLNPASCWRQMTVWGLFCQACGLSALFKNSAFFNREGYGGWKRDYVRHVDIVSGCFLLIRKKLWNELGGFSPDFFMYGEDADLCLRARKLGSHPMITPDATIVHYGGASERLRHDKLIKLLSAKIHLIRIHWSSTIRIVGVVLLTAWPLSRLIGYWGLLETHKT